MRARTEISFRNYLLDDFQREAIDYLLDGYSVLVSAPTGVGKTLIADYLIAQAIAGGKRVVYTAPIKALSNQKYKEFKDWYGEEKVGIITGDIVINSEAEVTIMTTEIFRNMLQQEKKELEGLSHVIFDEIHYLADESRGTVWEESIIFMPAGIRLLGLSATIPNARELAAWITDIKGH
jgi:superfamily II RNA helicase